MSPIASLESRALRQQLNTLNARISGAQNPLDRARCLQQYLAVADRLFLVLQPRRSQGEQLAAPFVPGGAVVSAAISWLGNISGASGGGS